MNKWILGLWVAGLPVLIMGQESKPEVSVEKGQYWLFKPTPRSLMREMSTDRPDQTESAYTIDAGHFQVESDLLSYTFDKSGDQRFDGFSPSTLNLKIGVLNNVDLQVGLSPHIYERTLDLGTQEKVHSRGFGDIVTRMKVNLWGNDSGPFAIAMMPFIKAPTASGALGNGAVEGGIIIPAAFSLPAGWGMGLMTEYDFVEDADRLSYHTDFVNSITFSHEICGPLSGYVEFFTIVSSERDTEWQGMFDFGFAYALTENIQVDTGVNIGVTESAPDWNPFIGISFRY